MDNKPENRVFAESVRDFTADDITARPKKKKSLSDLIFDNLRIVILIVCSVVLVWSLSFVVNSVIHYGKADQIYGDAADMMNDAAGITPQMFSSPTAVASPDYSDCQKLSYEDVQNITDKKALDPEFEKMKAKLSVLKDRYPELYGWIRLPNTNINYPIMKHSDNDYYLTHSYTGSALKAGAIFADFHNSNTLLDNYNLVLYGHHMLSNSMFRPLDKFLDEKFFEKNNKVYVYTLDGIYVYTVYSVYNTDKYYPYIQTQFMSFDSFLHFAERTKEDSIYSAKDVEITTGDRLLTLSTCSNRSDDGRLAVHAKLTEIIN